jgi:hypothetical protein
VPPDQWPALREALVTARQWRQQPLVLRPAGKDGTP